MGYASGNSGESSAGRSVMSCGKMIPVKVKIMLCFCWLDMPWHTTMLDDNQRGPEHRPLCPGPLKNTHCLWKWCQRGGNFRRGCWRDRPWARHKHMFGDSEEEQNKRKTQEARAWFDFIQSSNVGCHTNVKEDWDRPEDLLQSVMWC